MKTGTARLKLLIKIITTFFIVGYIIYPLFQLVIVSFSKTQTISLLFQKQVLTACYNSFILSVISIIGSACLGTFFACCFHYKKIWFKKFFSTLILLPIAIPPIVGVMSYLFLLGDNGIISRLFGIKNLNFSGWPAIIIIHLYSFYPLTYLFVSNTLKNIDGSIVEAARTLGSKRVRTFFSIILPQLKPPLFGAALLTFMASMASFSAPFIFGGSQRFLTTEIYYAKINGNTSFSALLSLSLVFISLITLYFFQVHTRKLPHVGTSKGIAKKNKPTRKKFNVLSTVVVMLFSVIIILPVLSLLLISLMPENAMMQNGAFNNFSFFNYQNLFAGNDFLNPLVNSVEAAVIAVMITAIGGIAVANIIRRKSGFFKSSLELAALIPYGVPGTVLGICMILSFNLPSVFAFQTTLVGTFWILPIVYCIRNLPITVQAIRTGLHSIEPSAEEAAATMGAGYFTTWRSVTMPLLYPSILDGAMLVFINAFGEFVATVLLYTYSSKTIPIEIYAQVREYNNGVAAAYGIIIFLVILSVIYVIKKTINKIIDSRNISFEVLGNKPI